MNGHVAVGRIDGARHAALPPAIAHVRCPALLRRRGRCRSLPASRRRARRRALLRSPRLAARADDAVAARPRGRFEDDEDRASGDPATSSRTAGRCSTSGCGTTSVKHVALPWGVSGALTREALQATGHETAFAERPLRRRGAPRRRRSLSADAAEQQVPHLPARSWPTVVLHGRPRWLITDDRRRVPRRRRRRDRRSQQPGAAAGHAGVAGRGRLPSRAHHRRGRRQHGRHRRLAGAGMAAGPRAPARPQRRSESGQQRRHHRSRRGDSCS